MAQVIIFSVKMPNINMLVEAKVIIIFQIMGENLYRRVQSSATF